MAIKAQNIDVLLDAIDNSGNIGSVFQGNISSTAAMYKEFRV